MYWLIGVTIVVKVVLSFFLELGNDEVYYYTYAVQPDWNHFDHPGMVGWMMRLTSLNLHWVSTLSMRLGSIICAGLATMVIFKTGAIIKDEKAGYIAAWM
jgi:4-amino-4-deoxy-L-arabinose transferase-like glycosyltransferase